MLDEGIRIEVPKDMRIGLLEDVMCVLNESRERNLRNQDSIDYITVKVVKNSDGSVYLVPFVVCKSFPSNGHGPLRWPSKGNPHQSGDFV
jgi:hypothetical protein